MAQKSAVTTHHATPHTTEWVVGLIGLATAAMGGFLLLAGENQYVGLGGDLSWRVGDIHSAWGYSFIGVGIVLTVAAGALTRVLHHAGAHLASYRKHESDLLTHTIAFVLVNAFLWIQDMAISSGLDYAYWVTIPWAIGLAIHAIVVWRERSRERAEIG